MLLSSRNSFRHYLPTFIFLFIVGWGGLAWLVFFSVPAVWQRWGFFTLLTLGLTGTALPLAYYFNLRFPSLPPAGSGILLRQALWLGIYGSTLAWLQMGGLVNIWTIVVLGAGLAGLEYFIRLRERTRWQPPDAKEDAPSQPLG